MEHEREFCLTSVESVGKLRLDHRRAARGAITASAMGHGFCVSSEVSLYLAPSLPEFIEGLAAADLSPAKVLTWTTLERELTLHGQRDALGHVFVTYELRSPDAGSDTCWSFTGRLVLELGSLAQLGEHARRFWGAATCVAA